MSKQTTLHASILKRKPSRDIENALKKIKGNSKNDSRVPLNPIHNTLNSFLEQQEQQITVLQVQNEPPAKESFQVSYSLISSCSFYETVPFEDEIDKPEPDNALDITYFGFDLGKQALMLRRREHAYQAKPNYLRWQPNITIKMRMELLYWLSEVSEEFEFHRDTWNIAVNCVDRFLSSVPTIARAKLQLIGIAAILVACKMEENNIPSISTLEQLCDGACQREEITKMEKLMLQNIGWLLMPVTPYVFLRLYLLMVLKSKASLLPVGQDDTLPEDESILNTSDPKRQICKGNGDCSTAIDAKLAFPKREFVKMMHIVDIALMDYRSLQFSPSLIAASVLYLVYVPGDALMYGLTGYSASQMTACIDWLRPFTGVPMPKSNYFIEREEDYCTQTSNPNAKAFLENYLSSGCDV